MIFMKFYSAIKVARNWKFSETAEKTIENLTREMVAEKAINFP